jgi:hypothetical protein
VATLAPITLHQGNDETIDVVIDRVVAGDDLTDVLRIVAYLKDGACEADDDDATVILDSADPAQAVISTQSAEQITGQVFVPAAALTSAHDRFWRLDTIATGGTRRTALYGPVTVIDT